MPELPEVETVRRQLQKEIVGRRIRAVEVRFAGRLNVPAGKFAAELTGARFKNVSRRAKMIVIGVSGGHTLLVHLKMTGLFRLVPKGERPGKHDHVLFRLNGPHDLFFNDFRKFGFLKLYSDEDARAALVREGYGPEPLAPGFDAAKLGACLARRPRGKIKQVLMDQRCVAGIGNIYADESLFVARLAPTRTAASLKKEEVKRLRDAVVMNLKAAVRRRGTSAENFFDIYGRMGTNVRYLNVYGRGGEPCPRCGTPLKKVKLAGRGTVYCGKCQR